MVTFADTFTFHLFYFSFSFPSFTPITNNTHDGTIKGGLNFKMSEGDVIAVFSQYGEPNHVNLVRDEETGKSKGFCFLGYNDQRSTRLAVVRLPDAFSFRLLPSIGNPLQRTRGRCCLAFPQRCRSRSTLPSPLSLSLSSPPPPSPPPLPLDDAFLVLAPMLTRGFET